MESLSEGLKQAFIRLITKHTGLEIRERDKAALSEKIFLRIKALKLNYPELYYQFLESSTQDSQEEWHKLMVLITNIESYFFRDTELFSLLRYQLLPELIERKRTNKTIRICSAGCSSGEEPYSLAILLTELIPDIEQWNLMILGVDINQAALQKAQAGIYTPWSFRQVEEEIKNRYFQQINNHYHLAPSIQAMVRFQPINLVKDSYPRFNSDLREIDLILCRNVFIYFEASAITKVLNKFYHLLQPLGYLITGHAELYSQNLSQFQTKVFPEALVYQRYADNFTDTANEFIGNESYFSDETCSWEINYSALETALQKSNIQMQQAALHFLKQLPPHTPIPKLGNLTAAELISQLESELNFIDQ